MDKPYRRYEMLSPLRFNDRRPIPEALIVDTLLELEEWFGAVSCESQRTQGYWRHESEFQQIEIWMTTYPLDVLYFQNGGKLQCWNGDLCFVSTNRTTHRPTDLRTKNPEPENHHAIAISGNGSVSGAS